MHGCSTSDNVTYTSRKCLDVLANWIGHVTGHRYVASVGDLRCHLSDCIYNHQVEFTMNVYSTVCSFMFNSRSIYAHLLALTFNSHAFTFKTTLQQSYKHPANCNSTMPDDAYV